MPPKKDPAKAAAKDVEADEREKELVEKELLINTLKSKMTIEQTQGQFLLSENQRLTAELESAKSNLRDITDHLTNEVRSREDNGSRLEGLVAILTKEKEAQKMEFALQLDATKAENQAKLDDLQQTIDMQGAKLADLRDFAEQKSRMEAELASLKSTLEDERRAHVEKLHDIERKAVQEKDRLKKEMVMKIKETKASMMRLTDNQLETTTKRTIMENEQMNSELSYQSRQTEKLLAKNQKLMDENAQLRREMALYRQTEEELAQRSHIQQKTIKTLFAKLKGQDSSKRDAEEELLRAQGKMAEVDQSYELLQARLRETEQEKERYRELYEKAAVDLESQQAEMDATAKFLVTCLQDVKRQIVTVVREGKSEEDGEGTAGDLVVLPGRLEELNLKQREKALGYLLSKLHAFQSSKQTRMLGLGLPTSASENFILPPISQRGEKGADSGLGGLLSPTGEHSYAVGSSSGGGGGVSSAPSFGFSPSSLHMSRSVSNLPSSPSASAINVNSSIGVQTPTGSSELTEALLAGLRDDAKPWGKRSEQLPLTPTRNTFLKKNEGRLSYDTQRVQVIGNVAV
eukprot:jgi/Mesvir1/28192/Mv04747-RA.1